MTAFVVLTSAVTNDVLVKMQVAVGCSVIGMSVGITAGYAFMCTMDWDEAARLVNARANADKAPPEPEPDAPRGDGARAGGGE